MNRACYQAVAVLAAFLLGLSNSRAATFSDANWTSMGGIYSVNGEVEAVVADGFGNLYAGGTFTIAGEVFATNIAKWNGSSWSALGSGIGGSASSGSVWSLAVLGSDLYVGGAFTSAGGKVSYSLAKARIGSSVMSVVATNSTASIQLSGVTGYQYDVQRTTNLTSPITWTTLTTNPFSPAPDGSFTFTDTNAPPGKSFYRTRELP